MARVTMYATGWCPYCRRAESLLRDKGVVFDWIDVEDHPDRREEMMRLSGRRTVPQLCRLGSISGARAGGASTAGSSASRTSRRKSKLGRKPVDTTSSSTSTWRPQQPLSRWQAG